MADETSRLNVEVDGTKAVGSIDRITAAFNRLSAAVGRSQAMFTRLGSTSMSVFSRMRAAGAGAFRALSAGFAGLRKVAGTFMSLFRTLLKIVIAAGAAFTLFARSVTDTGNKINKFINTLVILKGDVKGATEELTFLFNMANKLGTSFSAAAAPFVKFAAAAAGTLSDQSIRDVFESFSTVGVALQLTQSEVTGVFLALQQIASKGVVSMEELRLQLAERVPGAMRLGAQSMNMTMLEFETAVRDRTINAGEFLENFAAKLKETFGIAAEIASERLFADIQRLGNAFDVFRQKVFATGFEEGLKNLVRSATNFLNNNPELAQALGQFSKQIFDNVSTFLNSLSADRVVGILNQLIGAFEVLINAINRLVFIVNKAFNDDLGDVLKSATSQTIIVNRLLEARTATVEALRSLNLGENPAGLSALGLQLPEEDRIREMTKLGDIIVRQNQELDIQRGVLIDLRDKARDLGVEFENMPSNIFDKIGTKTGPASIEIPRIELQPPGGEGMLDFSNQPETPKTLTTAVTGALEQAERLQTMTMPEFWQAIVDGRIRDNMDKLVGLQFDYNKLIGEQATLLATIEERRLRIDEMLLADPATIQAEVLNGLIREQTAATEEFLKAEEQRLKLQKDINQEKERQAALDAKLKSFQQSLEETFTSVQDAIFNSIKKVEDSIVDMVATGKFQFKDLANSIIRELARIAVQAFLTRFILGPLLGGVTTALGDRLGGTFATPQPPSGPNTVAHTGGVVGQDKLQQRNSFDRLRNNEQPIIVQKGEGIFTQQQMSALAPLSAIEGLSRRRPVQNGTQGLDSPVVNVNQAPTKVEVINHSGSEANVETETTSDGTELIRVIIGAVASDIARDGDLSKLMKGKFGLRNRTGLR